MKAYSIIVIYLFILSSYGQAQNNTTKFQDKKGKFKISFPAKPKITTQTSETEYGNTTIYSFKAEPKNDNNLSYEVYYLDYPQSFVDTLSTEGTYALFNGSQKTNINDDNIRSVGVFNRNVLGYVGREYRWQDVKTNKLSRILFYMVNNRMYILTVNTEKENNFNVSINQFFESFELIDTKPNPKKQVASGKKEKIYKIKFPKAPETQAMQTPTEYGNAKIIAELYKSQFQNDDNLIYMVTALEYPKDITKMSGFNLDNYYSNVIKGASANRQSTVISKKKISKNGVTGIEVQESFQGGRLIIKYRTFLKGNIQIGIQVMTIPRNNGNKSMNDFFDSFEFIDK